MTDLPNHYLENIIDSLTEAIVCTDLSGVITFWNPGAQKLLGYRPEEVIGKNVSMMIPPGSINEQNRLVEQILWGEVIDNYETTRLHKNGSEVNVSISLSPIRDQGEKIIGISRIAYLATDRKILESKSQALLESAPDAMVIVNQFGQIVLVNAQTEKMFEFRREELIGQSVEVLIPDQFAAAHPTHRKKFFSEPRARSMGSGMELFGKRKSGEQFVVEVSLSPLQIESGLFVSAAIRDITSRKKAEDKFKALLESAPDAMVIVDRSGTIQLVNAQTEKIFGYAKSEMIGQKVEILIPARSRGGHPANRDSFFEKPNVRSMGAGLELWALRKGGEEFPVEISLSPLETEDGTLVSAAIRDITSRNKAEEKFKALLESAPDAMVIVDRSGTIQLVNAQTEKIFGYAKSELIGQKVEILIPSRSRGGHEANRNSFFNKPNVRPMGAGVELWALRKNGEEFPVEISLSPLETEDGTLVSAAIRDVTENKKVNQELQKLNSEQRNTIEIVNEQNQRLLNFAHIVSHNLRSHSGNFGMLLNLYKDETDATERAHVFQLLERASEQMMETINNLNEVITIQLDIHKQKKPILLKQAVESVQQSISTFIIQQQANIEVDIPDDLEIMYPPSYLDSIILNFLTNGLRYRHPERNPELKIKTLQVNDHQVLEFRDNGLGIDLKRHGDKLFGMYKTFHGNKDAKGLGLFITKNQVEAMGGKIEVQSEVGLGTTFRVFFS